MKLTKIESYEIQAFAFRVMTGYTAPGKDVSPLAYQAPYEERFAAWDEWRNKHAHCILAMLHGFEALIDRDDEPTGVLLDRLDKAERENERLRAERDEHARWRAGLADKLHDAESQISAAWAALRHAGIQSEETIAEAIALLRAENERLVAKIVELVDACELLRVENSKSEREALCWQELDRFISTCDPANAAAWKRLRKRIDEAVGQAIDAARAAESGKE